LLAQEYHNTNRHEVAEACLRFALAIQHEHGYAKTQESDIHDLLARSLWKQARYEEGLEHATKALELCPSDDRLKKNKAFFVEKVFIRSMPT
jgi:tetratricopeptide (TPR) repeat protein